MTSWEGYNVYRVSTNFLTRSHVAKECLNVSDFNFVRPTEIMFYNPSKSDNARAITSHYSTFPNLDVP